MNDSCSKCVFFRAENGEGDSDCRRFPPIMLQRDIGNLGRNIEVDTRYPYVAPQDWCGEFSLRS